MRSGMLNLALFLLLAVCVPAMTSELIAQDDSTLGAAFWNNSEPNTAVITKLFINDLDKEITAYETCRSGDCSWGRKSLRMDRGVYVATYNQDFARYELNVRIVSENQIHVLAKMKYRDSNNWDIWEYSFYRSDERGSSGGISNK